MLALVWNLSALEAPHATEAPSLHTSHHLIRAHLTLTNGYENIKLLLRVILGPLG